MKGSIPAEAANSFASRRSGQGGRSILGAPRVQGVVSIDSGVRQEWRERRSGWRAWKQKGLEGICSRVSRRPRCAWLQSTGTVAGQEPSGSLLGIAASGCAGTIAAEAVARARAVPRSESEMFAAQPFSYFEPHGPVPSTLELSALRKTLLRPTRSRTAPPALQEDRPVPGTIAPDPQPDSFPRRVRRTGVRSDLRGCR